MTSPFEELKELKGQIVSSFVKGKLRKAFGDFHSETIDQYFRRSVQESETGQSLFRAQKPFALVAVGGYGRRELCLNSDIDILILFGPKIPKRAKGLVEEILYPLWDLSLDLGYGIRTIKDCLSLSKDDFEVFTSLLDARFICGDSPLFLSLIEVLQNKVIDKRAKTYRRWLEDRDNVRLSTFGDSSYLLEPELKQGIGGLRDYHHMLWLSRVFFRLRTPRDLEYHGKLSHGEYEELRRHLEFIWLVRNHLHHLAGRKNDRLIFEYQEKIADKLRFRNKRNFLAVEQFMGQLHASMASVKSLHRSFITSHLPKRTRVPADSHKKRLSGNLHLHLDELYFDSATRIISEPVLLIEIFEQSSRLGAPLSLEAKRLVREFIYLVDDPFRQSGEAAQMFLNIMKSPKAFETLDQMLETGLLGAFIPEFDNIRDRVQFDDYHIYPFGRHSLQAVRHLKGIRKQKDFLLLDIFSDLSDPLPLFLAGLFHDVGKMSKHHPKKGATLTNHILNRFGYDESASKDVLFLIENHPLLMVTATQRDLGDEKVVVQCARSVGNIQRLKMLYLLTWADSVATGPRAWTQWTANLVQELFFKILHTLEKGELATQDASQRVKKNLAQVRRLIGPEMNRADLDLSFEMMSPRYLLQTKPRDIVNHLEMYRVLKEQLASRSDSALSLEAREDESEGCWEAVFFAKDRPGLFSDLAGVMALNSINVLSAHIYTWRDGTAVDIFRVTKPLDPIRQTAVWEKIKNDLINTFKGKLCLEDRLREKAKSPHNMHAHKSRRLPRVKLDNNSSDFFTLVEVSAEDRVGLLYLITRTLFNLELDIRIAKIATKGDRVTDVFYLRDLEGQKVLEKGRVKEIRNVLLERLKHQGEISP